MNFLFILAFFSSFSCNNPNPKESAQAGKTDTTALFTSNDQTIETVTRQSGILTENEAQSQAIEPASDPTFNHQKKEKPSAGIEKKLNHQHQDLPAESVATEKAPPETAKTELIKPDQPDVQNPLQKTEIELKENSPEQVVLNQNAWGQLLQKYVSATGKVNYKGMKAEKADLDAYLKYLENNPIQDNWSKAKKMAWWINAYNAFTVKMIVDNYPVSSITKLHGGKPWDVKWIKLNGRTYTLNNIENDILRPEFKDARIHFAVNCAAQSCPPILNEAWTESNLEQMLEKQAKAFINNPKFNTIKNNEIEISRIFEWYAVDFGNIVDYLNRYSNTKISKNAKVKYKEYDWNLNE